MANGWKPKKQVKNNFTNVFSINYHEKLADEIVKELYKNKNKYKDRLVYLGTNSLSKVPDEIILTLCTKINPTRTLILRKKD